MLEFDITDKVNQVSDNSDKIMLTDLDFNDDNMQIRRQISDCWEYDTDNNKEFIIDSKINSSKVIPDDQVICSNDISDNLSQSYYNNFLNQLKDDDDDQEVNFDSGADDLNVKNEFKPSSSSPNSNFDNYIKSGKTMKTKKNSFLKVEEFRKSKQFREGKIPTNTSFSGAGQNQIQNLGLQNYEMRK